MGINGGKSRGLARQRVLRRTGWFNWSTHRPDSPTPSLMRFQARISRRRSVIHVGLRAAASYAAFGRRMRVPASGPTIELLDVL